MVVQKTIHHLKTRPHHERRAVALLIAMGVVGVLFLGWGFIFFSGIHATAVAEGQAQQAIQAQQAAADAAAEAAASSTNTTNTTNLINTIYRNSGQ